jgi:hypothetical protein
MATFKILNSRRGTAQASAEFEVQPIEGSVEVGDEFRCYDTHHPVDYRVQAVRTTSDTVILSCAGFFGFDEQFVGAVIDTAKQGRPGGFHYGVV